MKFYKLSTLFEAKNLYESSTETAFRIEKSDISKISLLSNEEAEFLAKKVRMYPEWWWLATHDDHSHRYASIVRADGDIRRGGYWVAADFGAVRPALYIPKFRSLALSFGSNVELNDKKFTVINPGVFLYNDEVITHYFNKTEEQGNDYEASDIKKFVENDFIDIIFYK